MSPSKWGARQAEWPDGAHRVWRSSAQAIAAATTTTWREILDLRACRSTPAENESIAWSVRALHWLMPGSMGTRRRIASVVGPLRDQQRAVARPNAPGVRRRPPPKLRERDPRRRQGMARCRSRRNPCFL